MRRFSTCVWALWFCTPGLSATHYVSLDGAHAPPFDSWARAATNIQAAINISTNADVVIVSNGVYASGTTRAPGQYVPNRICLDRPVSVRSLSGPQRTALVGQGPLGTAAVRCAFLTNGAELCGFTLSNGCTFADPYPSASQSGGGAYLLRGGLLSNCVVTACRCNEDGGGVLCYAGGTIIDSLITGNTAGDDGGGVRCGYASHLLRCALAGNVALGSGGGGIYSDSASLVEQCVITGNTGDFYGGGLYMWGGSARNCMITENVGVWGGGVQADSDCLLEHCSISGNRAKLGGGVHAHQLPMVNVLVYYNQAPCASDVYFGWTNTISSNCCCATLLPGPGNITNTPCIAAPGNPHLLASSPCIGAGLNGATSGADIDGEPWNMAGTVSIGCDEYWPSGLTGMLDVTIQATPSNNVAAGYPVVLAARLSGRPAGLAWLLPDGRTVSNHAQLTRSFATPNMQTFVLSAWNNDDRAAATTAVDVVWRATNHVVCANATPVPPYLDWASAATNIQDAIDVAAHGNLILLTAGVYRLTNSLVIDKRITLKGVAGAEQTIIDAQARGRAILLSNPYAVLDSLTISNGYFYDGSGGGIRSDGGNRILNCNMTRNRAYYGGGIYCGYGAFISNCALADNKAIAGTYSGACGGGMYARVFTTATHCRVTGNAADGDGGGICARDNVYVRHSLFTRNWAVDGGGLYLSSGCLLDNALVYSNSHDGVHGDSSVELRNCSACANSRHGVTGPSYGGPTLLNSIAYFNGGTKDIGYGSPRFSCQRSRTIHGCITNPPRFVGPLDFHLSGGSPCIDSGTNLPYTDFAGDLDGNPRAIGNGVDMGAYEYGSGFWASVSARPRYTFIGQDVAFLGRTPAAPGSVYFCWDFDNDGTVDIAGPGTNSPVWQYDVEDVYSVALSVSNTNAEIGTATRVNYIVVVPEPHSAVIAVCTLLWAARKTTH